MKSHVLDKKSPISCFKSQKNNSSKFVNNVLFKQKTILMDVNFLLWKKVLLLTLTSFVVRFGTTYDLQNQENRTKKSKKNWAQNFRFSC